jgi:hypothetical protein
LTDFILALLEDRYYLGRNTPAPLLFIFFVGTDTIRAKAEVFRSRALNLSFSDPWMVGVQPRELCGKGDILDLSAGGAAEVTVLFRDGIEALLTRARIEAADDPLGCHEFQVAINGPEADSGEPFPDPQVQLIGAGMIPAEAEFLQNHGPLLRFSQNSWPGVIIVTITILKFSAFFVKPDPGISRKILVP